MERRFGSSVALEVARRFDEAFRRLAGNPWIGHRRRDLTDNADVRFWAVGPTLVAYRIRPESVEVLLVERSDLDRARLLVMQLPSPNTDR